MDGLRFCILLLAGQAFMASPSVAYAEVSPVAANIGTAAAVNLAGRQRMLSQRIVKAYLMAGQGISADDARAILQGSIEQFESQLAALKGFQPTPGVRSALVSLEDAWNACRPILASSPSKAGAAALYDVNEELQKAAHSVTLAYEGITLAPLDHLIGITGRQRMLLQRMAKFYFYRTWELYDGAADMELHLSRAHFTAVLNQIENSHFVSPRAKASAARVRNAWGPYQAVLFANREPEKMRGNASRVAELSEQVLVVAEELVAQLMEQAQSAQH